MEEFVVQTTFAFVKMDTMAPLVQFVIFFCQFFFVWFIFKTNEIVIGCNDNRGCLKCHNDGICNPNGVCVCKPGFAGKNCAECNFIKKSCLKKYRNYFYF